MELFSICMGLDGISFINQCMFSREDKIKQKKLDTSQQYIQESPGLWRQDWDVTTQPVS